MVESELTEFSREDNLERISSIEFENEVVCVDRSESDEQIDMNDVERVSSSVLRLSSSDLTRTDSNLDFSRSRMVEDIFARSERKFSREELISVIIEVISSGIVKEVGNDCD